jgi:hypothetical protein
MNYIWLSHHIIFDIGLEADFPLIEEEKLEDPQSRGVDVLRAIVHQVLKEVLEGGIDDELSSK